MSLKSIATGLMGAVSNVFGSPKSPAVIQGMPIPEANIQHVEPEPAPRPAKQRTTGAQRAAKRHAAKIKANKAIPDLPKMTRQRLRAAKHAVERQRAVSPAEAARGRLKQCRDLAQESKQLIFDAVSDAHEANHPDIDARTTAMLEDPRYIHGMQLGLQVDQIKREHFE